MKLIIIFGIGFVIAVVNKQWTFMGVCVIMLFLSGLKLVVTTLGG